MNVILLYWPALRSKGSFALASLSATLPLPAATTLTRSQYLYLPPSQQVFQYDADGNLTDDGRWTYVWDAENRLIEMTEHADLFYPSGAMPPPRLRLQWVYDASSRRVAKTVYAWQAGNWSWLETVGFIYNGWNLMAELRKSPQQTSWQLHRSYLWGRDLSGTEQGAGGVGGLLAFQDHSSAGRPRYQALRDGNGNVQAYLTLDASPGQPALSLVGTQDHDPYGNTLTSTLPARFCPIGFSSKYEDEETGLLYYGYRYYSPETGRWLIRDPIGEEGGLNLYGMCRNDAVNRYDVHGEKDYAQGDGDPTLSPDPGAGTWGGTPRTFKFVAIKEALQNGGGLFGWPNANAHLQHYLGNRGAKYTDKLEDLVKASPSAKRVFDNEVAMAMKFAEQTRKMGKIYSMNASPGYASKSEKYGDIHLVSHLAQCIGP